MADFILLPAIVMGILIGLVEIFFVHSDQGAMGAMWLKHALHALPITTLFVFASMNVHFVLGLVGINAEGTMITVIVRVVIALLAMLKVAGAASIARGAHIGEKMPHTLVIGALIFAAPYAWDMFLEQLIGPYIPF